MSAFLHVKTTKKRTLAGVGAIFAAILPVAVCGLALAGIGAGCGVDQPEGGKPPAIVLGDVTLRHYAADGTVRVGQAEEVIYDRQAGRLEGKTIEVDVPPTPNMQRGGAHLEAGAGKADLKGKGSTLTGGVRLRTGAGDRGQTESATWDAATETIHGDEPVQVEGPGYRTSADGFRFQVPGQQLDLRGDVKIHTDPDRAAP